EADRFGLRHIGLYAYRADFLRWFALTPPCELEQRERLEQLRALYHAREIHVEEAVAMTGIEVNSLDDLERARRRASPPSAPAERTG
ncbi:MAG: cytidylyltransferase domain-containing protein, partial [Burkholderiales bacterium]